jgi:hypothetical protein
LIKVDYFEICVSGLSLLINVCATAGDGQIGQNGGLVFNTANGHAPNGVEKCSCNLQVSCTTCAAIKELLIEYHNFTSCASLNQRPFTVNIDVVPDAAPASVLVFRHPDEPNLKASFDFLQRRQLSRLMLQHLQPVLGLALGLALGVGLKLYRLA